MITGSSTGEAHWTDWHHSSVYSLCLYLHVRFRQHVAALTLLFPHAAPQPSEALMHDSADLLRVIMLHCYYVPSFRMSNRSQASMSPVRTQILEALQEKMAKICLPQFFQLCVRGWLCLDRWNLDVPTTDWTGFGPGWHLRMILVVLVCVKGMKSMFLCILLIF